MDFFNNFDKDSNLEKKWISVPSELEGLNGKKKDIKIELMGDGKPRAMAFFDIDGTLAHLSVIHGKSIAKLFPEQEPIELEETYYKGFKLGNSFREFDRMRGIYIDGQIVDNINVSGFVVDEVPLDEKGNPEMYSRLRDQFIKRL